MEKGFFAIFGIMDTGNFFSGRKLSNFLFISILIFILGLFNVIYKFSWHHGELIANVNLWNPTWLLFGPLHYLLLKNLRNPTYKIRSKDLAHFIPFFLFLIFFVIAYWQTDRSDPWETKSFVYFQNSYIVIPASLIPYSIYIFKSIFRHASNYLKQAEILLLTISGIYIMIAIVTLMLFFAWGIIHINMGFDYRFFSYGFLLIVDVALILYWLWPADILAANEQQQAKSYRNSELAPDMARQYQFQISEYFNNQEVYLTPNLSLDVLSKDLDIPKHYLSQLFNIHFGKNFHSFLAEYRINYAIKLLKENSRKLKIESLAYSCGFNSKTSFNRYFKEITGLAPSAYQAKLQKEQ